MANFIGGIIGLTLAVIVVTAVLIPQIMATNTDTWTAQMVALWVVEGLIAVMGLIYSTASFFGMTG